MTKNRNAKKSRRLEAKRSGVSYAELERRANDNPELLEWIESLFDSAADEELMREIAHQEFQGRVFMDVLSNVDTLRQRKDTEVMFYRAGSLSLKTSDSGKDGFLSITAAGTPYESLDNGSAEDEVELAEITRRYVTELSRYELDVRQDQVKIEYIVRS